MDVEKVDVGSVGEVFDDYNMRDMSDTPYDTIGSDEELKLSGAMKAFFMMCGFIGTAYCLYKMAIYEAFIWLIAIIFILDLMGSFDKLKTFMMESKKPREDYIPIER
jgi:hypothetical protein